MTPDDARTELEIYLARLFAEAPRGRRILVDRLWPRGMRKDAGMFEEWLPEAAPSTPLRRWYGHDASRHDEFVRRYEAELRDDAHADAIRRLQARAEEGPLILLTATRTVSMSHLPVLKAFLETRAEAGSDQ